MAVWVSHWWLTYKDAHELCILQCLTSNVCGQQFYKKKQVENYFIFKLHIGMFTLLLMCICNVCMHYTVTMFFQSVGDVLQERFAVEMKCNTALRLAALHMHERLDSCGQTRTSIKNIT